MNNSFDILIVGGGHAGTEAAYIASQFDLNVGIVTLPDVPLASTPCNPAVGGVGKGQIVRELDALGGLMSQITDLAGIQYRTLNDSKGYAVRSTRVQVDKDLYSQFASELISQVSNIHIVHGKVLSISRPDQLFHVELSDGEFLTSKTIIITAGTFLNGLLHCGSKKDNGGRVNCDKSVGLENLTGLKDIIGKKRFKTGTPARLDRETINWSVMIEQKSDPTSANFHWKNQGKTRNLKQVSCHITHTNEDTLNIIRSAKDESPMYNGQIVGTGPRYCPSIEDKALRYPDRNRHHVFVEPEGLSANTVYPNGISTSLPIKRQKEFIQTIPGLENAEILVPGYAVEYDVVNTTQLDETLSHHDVEGLYFAGQVNGTSGYEEAAAQGYVAGVNASLKIIGQKPLVFNREDSYIGVLIDDLISNEHDEPYRLFTARAENRLGIREDNAVYRMAKYRNELGLNLSIDRYINEYIQEYEILSSLCNSYSYKPNKYTSEYFSKWSYGTITTETNLTELVKRAGLDPVYVLSNETNQNGLLFKKEVIANVAIQKVYDGYQARSDKHNEKTKKLDQKPIKWEYLIACEQISFECRQRIENIKPTSYGQLRRLKGIRPATLTYVANLT